MKLHFPGVIVKSLRTTRTFAPRTVKTREQTVLPIQWLDNPYHTVCKSGFHNQRSL